MRAQRREIQDLRSEVEKLRTQNERMSEAMRRCLACDYRREVRERSGGGDVDERRLVRDAD
jgi:hypothetical protein